VQNGSLDYGGVTSLCRPLAIKCRHGDNSKQKSGPSACQGESLRQSSSREIRSFCSYEIINTCMSLKVVFVN